MYWLHVAGYGVLFCFFIFLIVTVIQADTTSTLRPTADGGDDSASWTNTGGTACNATSCYTEVDESSGGTCTNSDGDTTYIQSANISGISQTFDLTESSIPDNAAVTKIDITVCYAKSGGGGTFQTRYCHNGSCSDSGTNISTGAQYAEATQSHTVNFTKTSSSDIEIGVTNTAAKNTRISQISAVVTYTVPADTTAPADTTDLAAGSATASTVKLTWTAPGDDGSTGTASNYDIRYSTSAITAGNWSSATTVTGEPTPSAAGSSETYTVTGLSASTLYYFALKTDDEVPNTSGLSNVPSLSTTATADTTAPADTTDLAAGNATASTIKITWTAPGDDGSTGTADSYDVRYSTSAITAGNWSSATTVTGEPTPSVAGSSESYTVTGLTAETTYHFALKTSDEAANESGLSNVPSLATSEAGSEPSIIIPDDTGGGTGPTDLAFSGQAYPGADIEVLQKDSVHPEYTNVPVTTKTISPDGAFTLRFQALLTGQYFFSLRAIDADGRKTGGISFPVDFKDQSGGFSFENILAPPTVGFSVSPVQKGKDVDIVGFAPAGSSVELELDDKPIGTSTAEATGAYLFAINTHDKKVGNYTARARWVLNGKASGYSSPRSFKVSILANPRADFNGDDAVTIADWSIFLFRWGAKELELRMKIDMNEDGKVDIADLSIFLKAMKI
jgi:hypothetical protein